MIPVTVGLYDYVLIVLPWIMINQQLQMVGLRSRSYMDHRCIQGCWTSVQEIRNLHKSTDFWLLLDILSGQQSAVPSSTYSIRHRVWFPPCHKCSVPTDLNHAFSTFPLNYLLLSVCIWVYNSKHKLWYEIHEIHGFWKW